MAPTAGQTDNSTQLATTAFVQTVIAAKIDSVVASAPGTLDTLNELAEALGDDPNFAATMTAQLAGKAPALHDHTLSDVTDAGSLAGLDDVTHVQLQTYNAADATTDGYVLSYDHGPGAIVWIAQSGGGGSNWGGISGTLSAQIDLQNALDGKADNSHTHSVDAGWLNTSNSADDTTDGYVLGWDYGSSQMVWVAQSGGGGATTLHDLFTNVCRIQFFDMSNPFNEVQTGSGGSGDKIRNLTLYTGLTSGSTHAYKFESAGTTGYGNSNSIDFSDKITIRAALTLVGATMDGDLWFWLGTDANRTADLNAGWHAIGFKIDHQNLKGICSDGTTSTEVDLATMLSTGSTTYQVVVSSDGAGNVEWFLDGVSKGTSTDGPTANATSANTGIGVANGGDSAAQHAYLHELAVVIG